ncbi:putative gustatory receptor 47b [Drosophila innubila]|uniref:putative gustatory receptor 47b n=1 Tax=Drosophila innubila TaxID=198719 RepID=UPI00148DA160|nr:putative gustatory receptor 47b [Drosophila innubila]
MQRNGAHGVGFVYCYDGLYSLLFYWGVITFRLHNLGDAGSKSTPLRIDYALGMRFGLILGFVGGVYVKLSNTQMSEAMFSHLSPLVKMIFAWESLSCILTYIQYCVTLDGHRRRHIKLLTRMQLLDSRVSDQFPNVHWRYNRTRSKYWYGTVGITISYNIVSLALMFETTRCSCGFVSTILIACTYSWMSSSLGAMGFVHIGLMDYLRIRYRLIIKLLQQFYRAAEEAKYSVEQELDQEKLHQSIAKLFEFSKCCSQLLTEMNAVCGAVAATGIFYDFTHMTCFVYLLCQKVLRSESLDTQYAFLSLHLVVHIYKVIITCTYGYLLQREKRNCIRLLSEYGVHFGDLRSIQTLVECFQHWRMHNNHVATIGSSFSCNISMIYVVFNGLANYVIVLVQLLFQLQLKDRQQDHSIAMPKDVELIKPIAQITHQNLAL